MDANELLEKMLVELDIQDKKMTVWIDAIKTEKNRVEHCRYLIYHHLNKNKLKDMED